MKKIAITGGIASGKTSVCHILKTHGACTLNSDQIVHHLLEEDQRCINDVIALLGNGILTEGKIDRKKVAEIVFNDAKKLDALEKILHPKLFATIDKEYERVKEGKAFNCFVVEMPLVQEIEQTKKFDHIVAVIAKEEHTKSRLSDPASYDLRMSRQWDPEKKAKHADYVIINNGTMEELKQNTLEMLKEINS
ncbi:MAG: dephospho-CoA kinase [Chlamydiia bacterium]|nr:dephospho-CoA kinase [Chlamydiia bacterium]MCP5505423.1 dephospho-CoA kinase [Chlamydiales bacterium]